MEFEGPNTTKSSKGSSLIGGIIFIVTGIIIHSISGGFIEEARASESWPAIEGIVSTSEIISSQSTDSDGKTQTMYGANVVVHYTVEGTEYNTDRIDMAGYSTTSSRNSVKKKISTYAVGTKSLVYYDPADPGYAVLEPGLPLLFKLLIFLPYLVIGIGIIVVLKGILKLLGMAAALGFLVNNKGKQKEYKLTPSPMNDHSLPATPPEPSLNPTIEPAEEEKSETISKVNKIDSKDDGFSI